MERSKLFKEAIERMPSKELSPMFEERLMERVRAKNHRREMRESWCIFFVGTSIIVGLMYLIIRFYEMIYGEIMANPYQANLFRQFLAISIVLFILFTFDAIFYPKIRKYIVKSDPKK
ncbi:MAG: hypothetical protein IKZ11_02700 [Alistipes sp.]|nr:hypothetical protein [Alistipes sp.]